MATRHPGEGRRPSGLSVLPAVLAAALAVASIGAPARAFAQRFTGELSGTVTDASGGVLPGATVILTNEASGDRRVTVTNSEGFFVFSAVPAATYKVTIELSGFGRAEFTGIELQAGDSRSLRTIQLKVGDVTEVVTVSAEPSLTPLTSGEKSATLTARQIENLPIVGTSTAEVLRTLPGMTPVTNGTTNRPNFTGEVYGINGNGEFQGGGNNNQSAIGNFSGNGTRTQALDITIDGAPGADPGCNCATSVNPNSEFVQEFKVLQSNFGAEHAKGPVAMSVVSKSGGRDLHGSAFASLRDYRLNSNEWFANKIDAEKVKNQFFYPGFTVGGPLVLPGGLNRNRDRLFFFVGYEYFKQRLDTGFIKSWVPTDAMRAGDFSQAANLGLSGSFVNTVPRGFANGVIPGSQVDAGGRVLMDLFPRPNADPAVTGGYNYVENLLVDQNGYQLLGRVDANISDSTKLFVRYNLQRETQPFVIGLWWRNGERQLPYPSPIEADNRSDSVTASLTKILSPTLTNEAIFAVTYIDFPNAFSEPERISRRALGYPYGGVFGESDQIPSLDAGSGGPMIFNPGGFDPVLFATKWQVAALNNVTKVAGTHTLKAGLFFEHVTNNQPGSGNSNGNIRLDTSLSQSTGNSFADLLLGRVGYYQEQTTNALHNIGYNRFEIFAQDTWRMRPGLTVDFGARFSHIGPWYDREGRGLVAWDLSRYDPSAPASAFPGFVWNALDSSVPTSGVDAAFFVQPRLGVAWDVRGTGETVVRGGFGVFKSHDAQQPYADVIDLAVGVRSFETSGNLTLAGLEGIGGGTIIGGGNALEITDDKQPTTYSWSTTVNQRLPWGMALELGYVGNRSVDLMNFDLANYNAVPIGAMLNDPEGDPNRYRPLPQYGSFNVFRHSMDQNYHGLQTLVTRQRGRFGLTGAYTFSKTLGVRSGDPNGSRTGSEYILDPRRFNYGVLGTDRTHVASVAYHWTLGDLSGQPAINTLLGSWQVSGISQFISGAPIVGNFDIQGTLADGTPINATRITGSPDVRVQPAVTCDPRENVPDGFLFDPACFAAPSVGSNGAYVFPDIRTQAYINHDLSLAKNLPVGTRGHRLQVRIAAYNVFNHPLRVPDASRNLTLRFTDGQQTNADFGRLPEDNKVGRRIVQIALRYTF